MTVFPLLAFCTSALRTIVGCLGGNSVELRSASRLPRKRHFFEHRKNPAAMKIFCDCILPCVVGKTAFRVAMECSTRLSDAATDVEEAFALLVLENIWPWWKFKPLDDVAVGGRNDPAWANRDEWGPIEQKIGEGIGIKEGFEESDEESGPGAEKGKAGCKKEKSDKVFWPGIYTIDSASGGTDGGWSLQGMKRFNKILGEVREDREKNGEQWDKEYQSLLDERKSKVSRKRRRKDVVEEEEFVVLDSL